jgi:hypothetical protein
MIDPYRTSEIQLVTEKRRSLFKRALVGIFVWWMSGTFKAWLDATHLTFGWIESSPRRSVQHSVHLGKLQVFADWLAQQPDDEDLMIVESVESNGGNIIRMPWYYVRVCQRRVSQLAATHRRAWVEK